MSGHTPGPWISEARENGAVVIRSADKTRRPIAEIWHNGHDPVANGALVAAAPDMLETLESINRSLSTGWTDLGTIQHVVRSALARASQTNTGE